jgi:hemolysin activation/secretion protein
MWGVYARLCACGLLAAQSVVGHHARAAAPPTTANPAAGQERAPDRFIVQAYDVSGVTRLTTDEVERLVYPHVGPGRTKDDVEAARKALQDAYAAKGYGAVIVDVPVQDHDSFAQGIVQIAVSEVPVGQVRVVGSRFHSLWVARDQVPALVEGQPVDLKALQTQVAAANHFPDRTIDPQFKPGRVAGEIDVDLKVTDQHPLHASVALDNDASPATSPLRLTASARYTNLFQTGQAISFTYVVAPENRNDTEVFAGSYTAPILNTPWTLSLSGYHSNSNVGSLGGSSVLGRGFQVGFRVLYRLPSAGLSQSLSFGADFKDFKQNILVNGVPASTAPISYVPLELQYALAGASEHTSYDLSLGTTLGIRAFRHVVSCVGETGCPTSGPNAGVTDAFENREGNSNESFVRANLTLDFSYAFKNDMIAALKLNGQFADSHLITNEQFASGGLQSVRGYYSSEAVGDNGIAPSVELRSPSLAPLVGRWLNDARLFGFADSAFIHVNDVVPGQHDEFELIGLGGGLRVRLLNRFSGEVLGAVPITSGPATTKFHPRVDFQVKGDF